LAQSVYEGMFILDAGRYGRDPDGVAGQIPKMIREADGEILVSRLWEERRLAFPIKGQRKGAYWLAYFRVDGAKVPEIRRKCQLSDTILRALFLKVDPRIVDALVEHAKAGPGAPRTEEGGESGAKKEDGEKKGEGRRETAAAGRQASSGSDDG
jgi:small subunit ribosomal protein S6